MGSENSEGSDETIRYTLAMNSESRYLPEHEQRALLEEQFAHPRVVEVAGERLEIFDLAPEQLKTEIPTMLVPGVGGTAHLMKENAIGLAEKGRRVIIGSAAHGIPTERTGPHPDIEYRKSEAIARTLNELQVDQVDIVGHSEASIILSLVALEREHHLRNLVFLNPAGLGGADSPLDLSKRTLLEMGRATAEEIKRLQYEESSGEPPARTKRAANVLRLTLKSLTQNPRSIWSSIVAGGTMDTTALFQDLRSQGHRIAVIHGVDDAMLPMNKIQNNVTPTMVDGFYSVRGGHNEMMNEPEKFNSVIDEALDALERRSTT